MRERNTRRYRLAHWPIWIWVFFLAPGPLTFDLFARGGSRNNVAWLLLVMLATGALRAIRAASRRRASPLHSSIYRRQAKSSLSQSLLHLRLERGHQLYAAEPCGVGDCRRDRQVGDEAALFAGLFPASAPSCCCSACWVFCPCWASTRGEGIERRISTVRYGRQRSRRRSFWCYGKRCPGRRRPTRSSWPCSY